MCILQEDLKHLRTLWDSVGVIMGKFNEWCSMLWDKIDVDFLIEECKQLAKDVRTLNKAVRAFEVYKCAPPAVQHHAFGQLASLCLARTITSK